MYKYATMIISRKTFPGNKVLMVFCISLLFLMLLPARAFGEDSGLDPEIELPLTLVVRGITAGEVWAILSPGDDENPLDKMQLHLAGLIGLLGSGINPEALDLLKALPGEYIPVTELETLGYNIAFDQSALSVLIGFPPELMPSWMIPLEKQRTAPDFTRITASPFSAAVTYNASGGISLEDFTGDFRLSAPLRFSLFPSFQLYRWVLEGGFTYNNTVEPYFTLDDLRLVRDFPFQRIRLTAGTLDLPAFGGIAAAGVNGIMAGTPLVFKNFPRQGHADPREIILEEPSTVTILLNGRTIKRLRLPAGIHTLTDIPYVSGLNTLRVVITRKDGSEEGFHLTHPFDRQLLPRGDINFSAAAGIPGDLYTNPLVTGYFSYGLFDGITGGISLQSDFKRSIAGLETIISTPLGNWGGTAAVFLPDFNTPSFYGLLQYRLSFPFAKKAPSLGLGFEYTQPEFLSSLLAEAESNDRYNVSGTLGLPLPWNSFLSLSSGYRFDNPGEGVWHNTFTFLASLSGGSTLSLSGSSEYSSPAGFSWNGSLSVSISPAAKKNSTVITHDLVSGDASFSFSQSGNQEKAPDYSFSVRGFSPLGSEALDLEGSLSQRTDHLQYSVYNNFSIYNNDEPANLVSNRLNINLSGSLLFAGGYFALTPPVRDSFALIVPGEGLKDQPVRAVNNLGGEGRNETTGGVIPLYSLTSYKETRLTLDLPEGAPDQVLTQERITLLPSYHSGMLIQVDLRRSIYGQGILADGEGRPLTLRAGEIRLRDFESTDGTDRAVFVFTDESGMFLFYDLQPGTYLFRLIGEEETLYEFTIPQGADNPFLLGTLAPVFLEDKP